jgi:hypothetical protein
MKQSTSEIKAVIFQSRCQRIVKVDVSRANCEQCLQIAVGATDASNRVSFSSNVLFGWHQQVAKTDLQFFLFCLSIPKRQIWSHNSGNDIPDALAD